MTPGVVSLSRTEVGRLADVLEVLVAQHGGVRRARTALHLSHDIVTSIRRRPAALRVLPPTLQALAEAVTAARGEAVTVEQLLRGQVELQACAMPPRPGDRRASWPHGVVVRR